MTRVFNRAKYIYVIVVGKNEKKNNGSKFGKHPRSQFLLSRNEHSENCVCDPFDANDTFS